MKNVLILNSSTSGQFSVSNGLSALFQQQLSNNSDFTISVRDLGANPPSHLDALTISGLFSPSDQHSPQQSAALKEGNDLITELKRADILIIASAMHNHTITSGLKTYFDQIARVGQTFQYGANGPEGLLTDKVAYVITSAGGDYSLDFMKDMDFQTPYLKHILGFVGITDVTFIPAQGSAMGPEIGDKNRAIAEAKIASIVKDLIPKTEPVI